VGGKTGANKEKNARGLHCGEKAGPQIQGDVRKEYSIEKIQQNAQIVEQMCLPSQRARGGEDGKKMMRRGVPDISKSLCGVRRLRGVGEKR